MKLYPVIVLGSVLLAGCASSPPEWLSGEPQCAQIGCGQGLTFYPNEPFAAQRHARRWYCFDWASHSSRYHPNTAEYAAAKQRELECQRGTRGVDDFGRKIQ